MTWLLALTGPSAFAATWLLGQTSSTGLTEALVAFGVITGLSGAVVKLWTENQRLQRHIEAAAQGAIDRQLPALGDAIAEMRETRRERDRVAVLIERTEKVLTRLERKL